MAFINLYAIAGSLKKELRGPVGLPDNGLTFCLLNLDKLPVAWHLAT